MKRGAETQISKGDPDDVEQEDAEPSRGIQKADEKVLATRQIRGLPKRSSTISLSSATNDGSASALAPEVPSVPKFGSFSGFGSPSSSSSSFTFTSPAPSSPKPTFGTPATSTASVFGTSTPNTSVPTVSPSASSATKAFASVLSPPSVPAVRKEEINPGALKYYSSLRGLNVSFLSAISKAVEQDPFIDVSDMVAHYKTFRISVQKEFEDEKPKIAPLALSPQPSSTSPFGASATPSSSVVKPPASMPAPPTLFGGFGGKASVPSSNTPASSAGSGFTPKVEATGMPTSGFSLPTPSATPTTSSGPTKSPFGSTASVPDFFSSSQSSPSPKPSTDSAPKTTSVFGPSAFNSSTSPFGIKSTAPSDASSLFGGGTFGSKSPGADNEKEKETKTESSPGTSTSVFGKQATSNPFSIPDKPTTTSLFGSSSVFGSSGSGASAAGASAAKPTSVFGGFGSGKSATFGNSVGFEFGSTLKTPDGETPAAPTSAFGSKPSGFGGSAFGAPPTKPVEASGSHEEEAEAGGSAIAASDVADDSKSLPTKTHDDEGEGEEDEETTHTTKSKVYKLHKKEDGSQEWKDSGVGMLRLKKHKTTGLRRVLLRNSSTGKITINFNIYSGLNPSLSAKFVTFVGHDEDGVSATYKLRTQSDQHAADLKNALDREIAFVKGNVE